MLFLSLIIKSFYNINAIIDQFEKDITDYSERMINFDLNNENENSMRQECDNLLEKLENITKKKK